MAKEILTGARAIFKLAGQKVGVATGVDVTETINYEPVMVLDNIEVEEFPEVSYTVAMNCEYVKIIGQAAKQVGFFPKLDQILYQPELVAEIYDSKTKQLVDVIEGVKPNNKNYTIRAGAVVGENLTFVAKRVKNVSEV